MEYTCVSIIIQARSTSKRFPGKIFEKIGTKQVLQHVLDACQNSSNYINAYTNRHGIVCSVSLAVPYSDALIPHYSRYNIIQGPEDDVLKRYAMAADKLGSRFIVRITSDCPFVPPYVISKMISLAVQDNVDFLTNADPRFRTSPDGHDVEVLSSRLLTWLDENASTQQDREHVTSYLHAKLPAWAKKGDVIGFNDYHKPENKVSIDTPEDLERLREQYTRLYTAVNTSPRAYRL